MDSWWREGVLYQVYPRSFADGDGDGHGDLPGLIGRLDHLAWLGIDGIWLSPTMPSPNRDWGYDVADYLDVHPDFGTLADLDRLVAEAGRRGIRVVLDLVPNHTSSEHPWFVESRAARDAPRRDWYVWADPRPDGSPPTNWRSIFTGASGWQLDEATGQYWFHNFLPEMPDLNWWSEGVREAFERILRFWLDRGVAGFRIDVAHALVKDRELRDNPPAPPNAKHGELRLGQELRYSLNRPETHEIYRRWRRIADGYGGDRLLLGETYVMEVDRLASFYGSGDDELHLAFNFPFVHAPLEAGALRAVVERTEALLPPGAWPVWTASNHDVGRLASRWAAGDEGRARCALLVLLGLRGTPVLYYGDELGLEDVDVPREALRDPVGLLGRPDDPGRDRCRTPMPWEPGPGHGFTTGEPWLPFGAHAGRTVAEQRGDPGSTLAFVRALIALRRERADLRTGAYASLDAPPGVWSWRRGAGTAVAVNLGDAPARVAGGEVLLRTRPGDGLLLGPGEGAVFVPPPREGTPG